MVLWIGWCQWSSSVAYCDGEDASEDAVVELIMELLKVVADDISRSGIRWECVLIFKPASRFLIRLNRSWVGVIISPSTRALIGSLSMRLLSVNPELGMLQSVV